MTDSSPAPDALTTWTDAELLAEWRKSSWEVGDPMADALAAEIERRNLDF